LGAAIHEVDVKALEHKVEFPRDVPPTWPDPVVIHNGDVQFQDLRHLGVVDARLGRQSSA
jgi:hypothetical protein